MKRYTPEILDDGYGGKDACMLLDENGEFVYYRKAKKLRKKYDALAAKVDELERRLATQAAGSWCYDIDSTPRDNREVLIAYKINGQTCIEVMTYSEHDGSWWNEDRVTFTDKPFAWASLNLPEFPK